MGINNSTLSISFNLLFSDSLHGVGDLKQRRKFPMNVEALTSGADFEKQMFNNK